MSVAIREIAIGDELMVAEMLDALKPGWTDQLAPGASGPRAFVATPGGFMFCAYVDQDPAGFAWGTTMRSPNGRLTTYLHELEVHAQHRRQSIGSMLLEASIARARREGHQKFWLSTAQDNREANALYTSLGGQSTPAGDQNFWWDLG